jgi:hypothetical protein
VAMNHVWGLGPWSDYGPSGHAKPRSLSKFGARALTLVARARGGRGQRTELINCVGNRWGGRFGLSSENGGGNDFGARRRGTQIGRDENGWWTWGEARARIPFITAEGQAGGWSREAIQWPMAAVGFNATISQS